MRVPRRGKSADGESNPNAANPERASRSAEAVPETPSLPSAPTSVKDVAEEKADRGVSSRFQLPEGLEVGGADAPVAAGDRDGKMQGSGRDDTVGHVGDIVAGHLEQGVGDFGGQRGFLRSAGLP